jgi:hypothetical protein
MKFMVMVHHRLADLPGLSDKQMNDVVQQHEVFTAKLKAAGVLVHPRGFRLRPATEMARLDKGHGERAVFDGPHPETKEVIGGLYVLEVKDRAEALEWAKQHPTWAHDTIEVREIWDC